MTLRVRQAMRVGNDDGNLSQKADGLSEGGVQGGIGRLRVGHPQERYAGSQDIHRVRARRDDADEGFHRTGQGPLRLQLRGEVAQFFARGQLAEQQKVGDLFERGLLRQIADRIAAVAETGCAVESATLCSSVKRASASAEAQASRISSGVVARGVWRSSVTESVG